MWKRRACIPASKPPWGSSIWSRSASSRGENIYPDKKRWLCLHVMRPPPRVICTCLFFTFHTRTTLVPHLRVRCGPLSKQPSGGHLCKEVSQRSLPPRQDWTDTPRVLRCFLLPLAGLEAPTKPDRTFSQQHRSTYIFIWFHNRSKSASAIFRPSCKRLPEPVHPVMMTLKTIKTKP